MTHLAAVLQERRHVLRERGLWLVRAGLFAAEPVDVSAAVARVAIAAARAIDIERMVRISAYLNPRRKLMKPRVLSVLILYVRTGRVKPALARPGYGRFIEIQSCTDPEVRNADYSLLDHILRGYCLGPGRRRRTVPRLDGAGSHRETRHGLRRTAQPHELRSLRDQRDRDSGLGKRSGTLPGESDGRARDQHRSESADGVERPALHVRQWRLGGRVV